MQKKILILVSNPKGTGSLNLPEELRRLKEAIQRSQQGGNFSVDLEFAANQTDLRRHILDFKPQILHFCGHGTEQGLWLDNQAGKAELATNEFLTELLKNFADRIECVLLNACETEPLATALAQHINYAIGMNQEVRDDAAIVFSEGFYDALGAGESYEQAFAVGQAAVLGMATSGNALGRKLTVVGQESEPAKSKHHEHLIPVIRKNPNPKPINQIPNELDSETYDKLLKALMSAFLDEEALALMVKRALPQRLNEISQNAKTYEATVSRLIEWAEANGQLPKLIMGALQQNPNNPKLKPLAKAWGLV
jgi:Effector-associated domain 1/CHAT domain